MKRLLTGLVLAAAIALAVYTSYRWQQAEQELAQARQVSQLQNSKLDYWEIFYREALRNYYKSSKKALGPAEAEDCLIKALCRGMAAADKGLLGVEVDPPPWWVGQTLVKEIE